jgi:hypothetical protein
MKIIEVKEHSYPMCPTCNVILNPSIATVDSIAVQKNKKCKHTWVYSDPEYKGRYGGMSSINCTKCETSTIGLLDGDKAHSCDFGATHYNSEGGPSKAEHRTCPKCFKLFHVEEDE